VATPSRYSFPSAHTAAVVAASRSFPRPGVARSLGAVAVATAFSRLYAGVHYPSDVAAGLALGWAVGTAFR
jgi:membrane-associated phospholipid phosphatase